MDGWMLFLAIVSAVGAVIAAATGVASVIITRRGNKVQNRQLKLQEEQAAMIPRLALTDIRFLRPEDCWEFRETLREMRQKKHDDEQAKAEDEWYERKSAEWEQEQREKLVGRSFINPYIKPKRDFVESGMAQTDPARFERRHYEGPMPNAVLDFQIVNNGKTAAHDVSGVLLLEAGLLSPIDFPDMDDRGISDPEDGFYRIDLARVSELLPEDTVEYRIGLQAKHPGGDNKVRIKYEFITPDGISLRGEESVELVPGSPR